MTPRIASTLVAAAFAIGCARPPLDRGPLDTWPDVVVDSDRDTDSDTDSEGPPPDPGTTRAVNDSDFLPAALTAIEAATSRIRVAEYLIYDGTGVDDLLDALLDAVDRGVEVQFLADETGGDTESLLNELDRHGVDTQLDSPRSTLHNKLIVADDITLVGSHNFTTSALVYNHEASVLVADAEVAAWYAAWFDAVWANPDITPEPVLWTRVDHVPLADRQVTDALISCVDGASTRVEAVIYAVAWNDAYPGSEVDRILGALEAAHERGVSVRVALDGSDWIVNNHINDAAIARLGDAGLALWLAPGSRTTHAKALLCDDTVIVGDANWSYSGLALYHGTSLQSTEPGVVEAYVEWMAEIRGESTAVVVDP